jgi:hypothetical protein
MDMNFEIGAIVEFFHDCEKWGIVKEISDCGGGIYVQRFGKGAENNTGYSCINKNLLRVCNSSPFTIVRV